ncbi:hypothetical protein OIE68_31985 [Nocardia vinacea]|uniref:hypothetical protein n=1 Tax=Nocardia vinacea TaxID=96468 RepID=UPI002E15006E|nr:hypothetical protein OIE68_31985 [Nocardia vinacea]
MTATPTTPPPPQPTDGLRRVRLQDIPGIEITYGVVQAGPFDEQGVPILLVEQIAENRLRPGVRMRISKDVHNSHRRSELQDGDLVLVLVGRVGDSARITAEHAGWNIPRAIGVIRCVDSSTKSTSVIDWLQYWLASPSMRKWFTQKASQSVKPTLSVQSLKNLEVPLPAPTDRSRQIELFKDMEKRASDSLEVAETALAIADEVFERTKKTAKTEPRILGQVCQARTGDHRRQIISDPNTDVDGSDFVVPTARVLKAKLPCERLGETAQKRREWQPTGQLLIATKAGTAQILIDPSGHATAARGTLSVHALDEYDQWWLLHELRSRREELIDVAQQGNSRELSARAFSKLHVDWPTREVRQQFAEVAAALHERAILAMDDHEDMHAMVGLLIEKMVNR